MLSFTPAAQNRIREILESKGQEGFAVRLRIVGRDVDSFLYEFRSVEAGTRRENDHVVACDAFEVFIDDESAAHLAGATVDFGGLGAGSFQIDNPNPVWEDDLPRQVAAVISQQINPAVAAHSGSVALVDVRDNVAYIRLQGGCQGCGLAGVTLRQGIEKQIREAVPQIEAVVDVTRHEEGLSPYYTPGQSGQSPLT